MHLNIDAEKRRKYDAIVIGSGISGGWSAKELCEKGLKTLVLERGRDVQHVLDYPTAMKNPWEFEHRAWQTKQEKEDYYIQKKCYAFNETTKHFFVKDKENPYTQTKPFDWIRGYHVGGKSLMWARQTYRWSELDFESNLRDGNGCDWPIRYGDIASWYSYVERFAGISGNRDGLSQIPDGEFLPPMELNAAEKHFKNDLETRFSGRHLVIGRAAHLTKALNGRGPCQYRSLCERGCPFGAYFSSNSATLPAAEKTGNMTLKPNSIVHSLIYDDQKGRATGVRVIDTKSKEMSEYYAKIIFVNAACLNTTAILMNSTSVRFPEGLGNDSGVLGHYLMDHNYRAGISATFAGLKDRYYYGRRPTGFYMPRFQNIGSDKATTFVRGYAFGGAAYRSGWNRGMNQDGFGADWKEALTEPGDWGMWLGGMGECLPSFDNYFKLNHEMKDEFGLPTLDFHAAWGRNEDAMTADMLRTGSEMLDAAGFTNIKANDNHESPGLGIHEMGTARMGRDPKTSVLNEWNQIHACKNVFVTDGAAMVSGACQNPSITYMALTARAADFAVKELKRQNL